MSALHHRLPFVVKQTIKGRRNPGQGSETRGGAATGTARAGAPKRSRDLACETINRTALDGSGVMVAHGRGKIFKISRYVVTSDIWRDKRPRLLSSVSCEFVCFAQNQRIARNNTAVKTFDRRGTFDRDGGIGAGNTFVVLPLITHAFETEHCCCCLRDKFTSGERVQGYASPRARRSTRELGRRRSRGGEALRL